jgi:hypothetical protein
MWWHTPVITELGRQRQEGGQPVPGWPGLHCKIKRTTKKKRQEDRKERERKEETKERERKRKEVYNANKSSPCNKALFASEDIHVFFLFFSLSLLPHSTSKFLIGVV